MTDIASRLVGRFGKPVVVAACVVLVLALGLVGYVVYDAAQEDTYEVTARFTATPGLYTDNNVAVLGVPEGKIVSITPRSEYVDVVMSLPVSVKLPADARAVLMAPNPVSDRFVQLTPPYTGGPALAPGATIPLARTAAPLELDQIYAQVDGLAQLLGPSGANRDGQLSQVLHAFAQLAQGNGQKVHDALTTLAAALPALTAHPDDLRNLVDGLDQLTRTLATHNSTLDAFYGDVAQATTTLAGDREAIATAVVNLQQGLAEVAQFIKANHATLGASVQNLDTVVGAVMSEQQSLIQTFDVAPLGFQNVNRAIDPSTPCPTSTGDGGNNDCPALWGRIDFTRDEMAIVQQYCGPTVMNSLVKILASSAKLSPARAVDTACAAEFSALQNRTPSPGAPNSPDLNLAHYLGGR